MSTELLAKLTTQGIVLDKFSKGGLLAIRAEDVAAALAYGKLSEIAYYYARAKYCDDHNSLLILRSLLTKKINQLIIVKKWPNDNGRAKKLAETVLIENISIFHCKPCKGRGLVNKVCVLDGKKFLQSKVCSKCEGSGLSRMSERKKAIIAGIAVSTWIRSWQDRYEVIVRWMQGYEEEIIRHLYNQFK